MQELPTAEKAKRGTLRPSRIVSPQRRAARPADVVAITTKARPYVAMSDRYVAEVLGGTRTAGAWVNAACARHQRDVARSSADRSWSYVWSPSHAKAACAFLELLPHTEGSWSSKTIRLEPWQCFLVCSLFGWRHRTNKARRRFTTVYLEVGRKNAKSTLMAGIALFHLLHEGEAGASVVCGATTGQQARIAFGIAQRMVQRSPALRQAGLQAFANAIITTDGTMKPVNAKASTQDGLNPSCIILDESHAQDFGLHDVLKSAQGARANPLLLCPTTAGYDLLSVGYALRTTCTKMLDQAFDAEHLLGLIYTLDEGDDWRDPAAWEKANPMLGVTPRREWVTQYCQDAQQTPGLEGEFKVKVCSLWLQSASAWLSMTAWDACADPTLRLEQFALDPCWIGVDLAESRDLSAVALCFEREGILYAFLKAYLPRELVEERARTVPAYREWARAGVLEMTDGDYTDQRRIEADVRAWCQQFSVRAIRFDFYDSARLVSDLADSGLPAARQKKNRETMTAPAKEFEERILSRRFRHDGNACLKWMASNVVLAKGVDGGRVPMKDSADSPNKTAGTDAILQAMAAWQAPGAAPPPQYQMFFAGGPP